MKTLADFKKKIQKGVLVKATNHRMFAGRGEDGKAIYKDADFGVRPVSIVQSNSFAFKTTKTNGEIVDSWCAWPKASEVIYNNENSITILEEQRDGQKIPVLTYEFMNQ